MNIKTSLSILLALSLVALCARDSSAEEMRGRVTHVADGDTFQFKHKGKSLRVRLIGIDAPEKGQAFAGAARRALNDMVKNREVRLVSTGRDRYGRVLAGVFVGKLAVQNELLRRGLVWVYPTYRQNKKLMGLERQARADRVGIWSHKNPVSPWDYKKRKRGQRADNQKADGKKKHSDHSAHNHTDHTGHDHADHDHADHDHADHDHDHNDAGDCLSGGKPSVKPAVARPTTKPGPPAGSGGCAIN